MPPFFGPCAYKLLWLRDVVNGARGGLEPAPNKHAKPQCNDDYKPKKEMVEGLIKHGSMVAQPSLKGA